MTNERFEGAYEIKRQIRDIENLLDYLQSIKFIEYNYRLQDFISRERVEEVNDLLRKEREIQLREELERLKKEFEEI